MELYQFGSYGVEKYGGTDGRLNLHRLQHIGVYKDNNCGLYDIQADSLVTAIKYDALRYGRAASEGGYEFTIWVGEMENYEGMISIESTTNEPLEIMFPKRQSTDE